MKNRFDRKRRTITDDNTSEQEGGYKRIKLVSPERLLATTLVAIWLCIAFSMDGLELAVQAFLIFMIPLTMIWLPDLLARIAVHDAHWERDFAPPVSSFMIRIVGWLMILGVPSAWMFLFRETI